MVSCLVLGIDPPREGYPRLNFPFSFNVNDITWEPAMDKIYRIFVAPSNDETDLPIAKSPWHFERVVKIPLGHWELIIEFARTIDEDKAQILEDFSVGPYESGQYIDIPNFTLCQLIDFMDELKSKLPSAESMLLFKDKIFDDIYDEYEDDEYYRMLEAVIAVYKESQRLGKPICAYND
jgi:hypothetical protein